MTFSTRPAGQIFGVGVSWRFLLLPVLLLLSVPGHAQKNTVTVFAAGNFNPATYVYLNKTGLTKYGIPEDPRYIDQPVISSDKSALGAGAEYQYWFKPHVALGLMYEQNPSDGKLLPEYETLTNLYYYIWPQMRYEALALATEQAPLGRLSLYIQEGGGNILTNGYSNSGWSHDAAFAAGYGFSYQLGKRTAVKLGEVIMESRQGCYEDHTCEQSWGTTQDLHVGLSYGW